MVQGGLGDPVVPQPSNNVLSVLVMPSAVDPIVDWQERNRELVAGCVRGDGRQKARLARVRAAFARARERLAAPLTLYRGTRVTDIYNREEGQGGAPSYGVGATEPLPCPLSFTRSRAAAREFADWSTRGAGTGRGRIHIVSLPVGTPVVDVARYVKQGVGPAFRPHIRENAAREKEVVLDRVQLHCTRVTSRSVYWSAK